MNWGRVTHNIFSKQEAGIWFYYFHIYLFTHKRNWKLSIKLLTIIRVITKGGRNEREGIGGGGGGYSGQKELVPATEPRDFHILQTLSTSELHLQSWKSLIYPLPIYLCFLNLLQETYCFHNYKKMDVIFNTYMLHFWGVGLPWNNSSWCRLCLTHFF